MKMLKNAKYRPVIIPPRTPVGPSSNHSRAKRKRDQLRAFSAMAPIITGPDDLEGIDQGHGRNI
jgi:hypothetical protein